MKTEGISKDCDTVRDSHGALWDKEHDGTWLRRTGAYVRTTEARLISTLGPLTEVRA